MRRVGRCAKCGETKIVQDHHIRGYGDEAKDVTAPYCHSCDQKAHYKARREGRCTLDGKETRRLSRLSSTRRSCKKKTLFTTLGVNVQLIEQVVININTGSVYVWSGFSGHHEVKLKMIDEISK